MKHSENDKQTRSLPGLVRETIKQVAEKREQVWDSFQEEYVTEFEKYTLALNPKWKDYFPEKALKQSIVFSGLVDEEKIVFIEKVGDKRFEEPLIFLNKLP